MPTAVATAAPATISEAFQLAKEEHSVSTERALDEGTGTGATATATQPNEAKTEPSATATVTTDTDDLISDTELQALKTQHANDPAALEKAFKAAYTKKTQALAEKAKGYEPLERHRDFITALDNPTTRADALKAAAEHFGFTLSPKTTEATATETVAKTATSLADDAIASFREALGPDLDFLADKLAPAIQALAKNVAQATVGQAVEPLKTSQQALLDKAATEQRDAVLASFAEKHPDWTTHEAAMMKIAETLPPGKGSDPLEYMSTLYKLATYDLSVGADVKKAIAKMTKGAAADEGKSTSVSEGKVALARPANPTLRDAFEAAKRGEKWD